MTDSLKTDSGLARTLAADPPWELDPDVLMDVSLAGGDPVGREVHAWPH
jgi:hypothetical protein